MAPTSTAGKPPGRQTNNSLSSLPDNLVIPSIVEKGKSGKKSVASSSSSAASGGLKSTGGGNGGSGESSGEKIPVRKKKEKSSQVFTSTLIPTLSFTETEEVLQIGMHKVLEYVKNHKDAWPFMDPVEEDIAPRYYSIIRRPMDLLKMEEKLDNGEYGTFSEFRNDFKLIVNNCRLYNGQNNEYTEMVNNLQEAFEKATKKYFEQNSSDEEDTNLEYPDLKPNVFREKSSSSKNQVVVKVAKKEKEPEEQPSTTPSLTARSQHKTNNNSSANNISSTGRKNNNKKSINSDNDDDEGEKDAKSESVTDVDEDDSFKNISTDKENHSSSGVKSKKHEKKSEKVKVKSNKNHNKKDNHKRVKTDSDVKDEIKKHSKQKLVHVENSVKDKEETNQKGLKRKRKDKDRKRKKKKEEFHDNHSEPEPMESDAHDSDEFENESKLKKNEELQKSKEKEGKEEKKSKHKNKESKTSKHSNKSIEKKSKHNQDDEVVNSKKSKTKKSVGRPKSTKNESKTEKSHAKDKSTTKSDSYFDSISDEEKDCFDKEADSEEDSILQSSPPKKQKRDQSNEKVEKISKKSKDNKKALNDKSKIKSEEKKSKSKKKKLENSLSEKHSTDPSGNKLSKSASISKYSTINKKEESARIDSDMISISSSPLASIYSSAREDLDETYDSVNSNFKRDLSQSSTPEIKDKYDLIKERRSKSNNSKSSDKFDSMQADTKQKKEKKPKHDKDQAKGESNDSKISLFDRLKDDKQETSKSPDPKQKNNEDEYDFVDDMMGSSQKAKKTSKTLTSKPSTNTSSQNNNNSSSNSNNNIMKKPECKVDKSKLSKVAKDPSKLTKPVSKGSSKKTNMEALELETEQTLKDINRWLEHTPRFPEFSSASNSPSRYILDDFDAVDPNDFRRPLSITPADKAATPNKTPPTAPADSNLMKKPKDVPIKVPNAPPNSSIPNQGVHRKDLKDKRKSLRDKIYNRKKEPSRTIDRLQPGKSKGNLLSTVQNINKPDELFPLGNMSKLKEVKNSLMVKTDESGPKLSLGTVLDTEGFGLIQQHNFNNDDSVNEPEEVKPEEETKVVSSFTTSEKVKEQADQKPIVEEEKKEVLPESKEPAKISGDKGGGTPNLNAWFKAFGAPKKTKKSDDEDSTKLKMDNPLESGEKIATSKSPVKIGETEPYSGPPQRMRKASTGSTVSERSSFSQDPDSPRVGIDERLAPYQTPQYSSPMASPVLTSPKPDELAKSNYSLNGAIKVGFYQDTTQKSSPEKSCSPRELPSPYPQYSQHVYSATSASLSNYANYPYNTNSNNQTTPSTVDPKGPGFYDQYKQPRSHESDYNKSSLSPNTNSPYQQHSPYPSSQHSPYDSQQQANAHQLQAPVANQVQSTYPPPAQTQHSPVQSPQQPQQQQQQQPQPQTGSQNIQPTSPYSQSNHSSPFSQQEPNSPYQQQSEQMSPFHPNSPNHSTAPAVSNPQTKPLAPQQDWQSNQSMHSPYDTLQQLQNQPEKSRLTALNDKMSPPMAHAPVPQQFNQLPQNIQPAHQNYPVYPHSLTGHPKSYDDSQSLFMSHQLRNDQSMYQNDQSSVDPGMKASNDSTTNPTQHQMFDHLMALRKSPFANISTSKALEMFNRAATMAFPKSLPSNVPSPANPNTGGPITSNPNLSNKNSSELFDFNYPKTGFNDNFEMQMKSSTAASDLINMGNPQQNAKSGNTTVNQQAQYSNRRATDLVIPNPRLNETSQQKATTDQRYDYGMAQMSSYRPPPFGSGSSQSTHLSSLGLDDRLIGMQQSGYYDKNLASNMFSKNALPSGHNANQLGYGGNVYSGQEKPAENASTAKSKRGAKKKKNSTPTPAEVQQTNPMQQHNTAGMGQMQQSQHLQHQQANQIASAGQQHQTQHHQQSIHHQGFQSYAGLKTAVTANTSATNSDSSAISLKTASMVPGSAFNFGPTPTGLALSSGIYGENSGYLDDFRNPANHYYLPTQSNDKTNSSSGAGSNAASGTVGATSSVPPTATPPAAYHQFLSHPPARPSYPFMNSQLDPNSPIYQQYFQRRQDEIRAQMMLNQQLLGPHPGAPPGAYPQPGYHHPSLGMHKPYDSMNRPSWL